MVINYTELGKRIREERRKHNYTQIMMADALNMSTPYISYIENGKKYVSLPALADIAQYLNITLDYLLFGTHSTDDITMLCQLLNEGDSDEIKLVTSIIEAIIPIIRENLLK